VAKLSKAEQDQMVVDLDPNMDEEEYAEIYDQLDAEHQLQADQDMRNFANNAIGSDTWDSDD
jgi:hypothetical protein